MSKPVQLQDATGEAFSVPGVGIIMASGPTVPSDNAQGYAKWALFHHNDGATVDEAWYINTGTRTAADFDALDLTDL